MEQCYTEWYNAVKGGSLTVVYKNNGNVLRDAKNNTSVIDALTFDPTSNTPSGVTYPINIGGTDYWFTKGNSASGGSKAFDDTNTDVGDFAWYKDNSAVGGSKKTHDVSTKTANALGIFDMSGNVYEWCFDISSGPNRMGRGGSWDSSADYLQVGGNVYISAPYYANGSLGFRPVRSILP